MTLFISAQLELNGSRYVKSIAGIHLGDCAVTVCTLSVSLSLISLCICFCFALFFLMQLPQQRNVGVLKKAKYLTHAF